MHVNPTLSQGLQVLLAAASNKSTLSTGSTDAKAISPANSLVPLSPATKNIAGQISAAMLDQLAQKANRVPAGMTVVPEEFGERPMSAEEFKQAVTDYLLEGYRRNPATRKPDPNMTQHQIDTTPGREERDKASTAYAIAYQRAFEEAAASGNLDIRRAREVEGHVYTMTRYVQVMEGRVVGGGMTLMSGVDDATRAAMAKGKHVSGGFLDNGIGMYFLTFDKPAYLKEAEEAYTKANAIHYNNWLARQAASLK